MDFYQIKERSTKNGVIEIYPDFKVCRSKDLMVRGRSFYAIWDEAQGMWSTDEYDVQRLIDADLLAYRDKIISKTDGVVQAKLMSDFSSKSWIEFRNYLAHISDNEHQLDECLTFLNSDVKKKDYVSKRLPYSLEGGSYDSYDELISTLYDPDERAKLEWAIGSIISGDSRTIQKFIVLYGEAGTGKSTIINIIQRLFEGYYTSFEAKALTSSSNSFSTEVFKANPLVAIQHDGDLSKIEDNTKLNSIISHEEMTMNEKYKPSYTARVNCFLFMGTNRPVKITDAKSGIIRRLIDVKPSGRKVSPSRYYVLMAQIEFELGAIAMHCLNVYREMGKNYYSNYRPMEMILQTDVFFNFVESSFCTFSDQDGCTLSQAYDMYKAYCDEALVDFKLPRHKFREELKNYFREFLDVTRVNGKQVRSYYSGFMSDKFTTIQKPVEKEEPPSALTFDYTESLFDDICANEAAQYASERETPSKKWAEVKTVLSDIDTSKLHYVKVPLNHIVIDFDLKDESGNKSLELNLKEATKWPPTYAELSKSGCGIHLHYLYEGDAETLSRVYSEGIEIKVFCGNSSLRRKLTKCNNVPIASISSGLPVKGAKMINVEAVKSEKNLRLLIERNLRKEIHPGTKPSVDFIHKILEDAYNSGLKYDVTDMRPKILAFANNSRNQAEYCIKLVPKMKFKSDEPSQSQEKYLSDDYFFYDVEVFPNLFVIVWKNPNKPCVKMINPSAEACGQLLDKMLIGFNCRRYDNHIIYARYIGYNNQQLYELSQRIIKNSPNALFGEAYNLSYTDVYEFSSKKQSLKKFEIELGIHHQELGLPWDQPVPEYLWPKVADYCCNDVIATEATFNARKQDFVARLILCELSGLTPNHTTQQHTAKIIFGDDKKPQEKFVYTDLSEMFPGYKFENGKSYYRGELVSEGGNIYSEPGMYGNAALLDIESMHPTSLIMLNAFGPYTDRFKELLEARLSIKHGDFDTARNLLGGILAKFLETPEQAEDLSNALKIVINIVYGMTSAKFENKFKDPRNIDNIVAKRGALFMVDLRKAVQEKGFTVAHIKTDSIKIPDATPEIIQFVKDFGKKYGYNFEHETTYDRLCLVNDSVYIARHDTVDACEARYGYLPSKIKKKSGKWDATGAQFAQPYLFKKLFSKEDITLDDMCEVKTVTGGALYIDMNENLPEDQHDYHFVGKAGAFCPIKPGCGGGTLLRESDGKYYAATGTKGYYWLEAEMVKTLSKEADIDISYYEKGVTDAINDISKYGKFDWFVSEQPYEKNDNGIYPF